MDATRKRRKIIFLGIILALIVTLGSFCVLNNNAVTQAFNKVSRLFYKEPASPSAALKTLSFVGHEYANVDTFVPDLDDEFYTINVFNDEDIDNLEVFYEKYDDNTQVTVNYYGRGEYEIITSNPNASPSSYTYSLTANPILDIEHMPCEGKNSSQIHEYIVPRDGTYRIELWGAKGGNGVSSSGDEYAGGLGAYTAGNITLHAGQKLYFYVGFAGQRGDTTKEYVGSGGFNGGGPGITGLNTYGGKTYGAGGGGGATDLRIFRSAVDDPTSLASRVMVAAGGGGGMLDDMSTVGANAANAKAGGGLYVNNIGGASNCNATQTSGFARGIGTPCINCTPSQTNAARGGGGGGYWGGNGYIINSIFGDNGGAGCGGSSYISGHAGSIGVDAQGNANTQTYRDISDSYNANGFVFTRTMMIDGTGHSWGTDIGEYTKMPMYSLNSGAFKKDFNDYSDSEKTNGSVSGAFRITQIAKYVEVANKLDSLTTSVGTLSPAFNPEITEYNLNLDLTDPEVTITGVASGATLEVTGNGTYALRAGTKKTVIIYVRETVTDAVKPYTITINRPRLEDGQHSAYLQYVKNPNHEDITILKNVYTYNLPISYGKVAVQLLAVPYDADATVEYEGEDFLEYDTGVIKIKVTNPLATPSEVIYTFNYTRETTVESVQDRYAYEYTGNYQTFRVPMTGDYRIETWGAQGGTMGSGWSGKGGKGGYTAGTVNLTKGDLLYVYVGKQGVGYTSSGSVFAGGWNGGGSVLGGASGGGGATDVRLEKGNWNDSKSLNSRIIVAGGGGGSNDSQNGGAGGGLIGSTGVNGSSANGNGGSQLVGGTGFQDGLFGIGGGTGTISADGGAGGGGYYGGGKASGNAVAGGGGSSYISGYKGAIAVSSATYKAPRTDNNGDTCTEVIASNDVTCSYHYSGLIFKDIVMSNGSQVMPDHEGTGEINGNEGNGYAVITPLSTKSENNFLKNITTNVSRLEETFKANEYEYTITVGMYNQFITLEGIPYDNKAVVTGDGKNRINVGENIIPITVTAENGDIRIYTVKVIREGLKGQHSNNLNYIELEGYDTIYVDRSNNNYEFNIGYNKYGVNVNAVAYDEDAIVTVTGNNVIVNSEGYITINVKHADNSVAEQIYKIKYKRQMPLYEPASEYTYSCTGAAEQFTAFLDGNYKIELWGAAGGGATHDLNGASRGGNGGYTYGTIKLKQADVLNLYVGCAGSYSSGLGTGGGWNGGGHGGPGGYGGGGATDVRYKGDTLATRILVAGGGGGADNGGGSLHGNDDGSGGVGGGLVGGNAYINGGEYANSGGTQTSGYALGVGQSVTHATDTGGAGGGYYGGIVTNNNNGGAGGGSGYIDEELFTDYRTIRGDVEVPSFDGLNRIYGNSGNGYIKISPQNLLSENDYLGSLDYDIGTLSPAFDPGITNYTLTTGTYDSAVTITGTPSDRFASITGNDTYELELGSNIVTLSVTSQNGTVRTYTIDVVRPQLNDGSHTAELQKIKIEGYADIVCIQGIYDYNLRVPDSAFYLDVTPIPYDATAKLTMSGFTYIPETKTATIAVRVSGDRKTYRVNILKAGAQDMIGTDFEYTGAPQKFTAPIDGTYKLEAWGAQGGNRAYNRGGRGAYATGYLYMLAGESIWIYVGGSGNTGGALGGWNGGGSRPGFNGGGGATDFRTVEGDLYTRFLVAGGGGSVGSSGNYGGAGGGTGSGGSTGGYGSGGVGASQTVAGAHRASFGLGGAGTNGGGYAGAGGGGWYGGGGANPDWCCDDDRGGGGGSSFALTTESYEITPIGYKLNDEKYRMTNTKLLSGGQAMPTYDGTDVMTGNQGNGHAKVTFVNLSDNNFLESIIVKSKNDFVYPEEIFNPERYEYNYNMDSTQTKINLQARPEDSLSTIEGMGEFEVPIGEATFVLNVISESGKSRSYTIKTHRVPNTEHQPVNIHISGLVPNYCDKDPSYCKLSPDEFNKDTYSYTMTIPFKIKQLNFTVDKVSDNQVVNGAGLLTLNKTTPDTNIAIEVQSEKCAIERDTTTPGCMSTYFYTITRDLAGDNDLANIEIVDPRINMHFDPDIYEYTIAIPYEYTKLEDMRITTDHERATYVVTGNENMELGFNPVNIIVTAPNGDIQTYILNVYREKSTVTYLKYINIFNYDEKEQRVEYQMTPEFEKIRFEGYELVLPNEINEFFIETEVQATGLASYIYTGKNLTVASNGHVTNVPIGYSFVNITVTAQDGSTDTYVIKVNRLKNSDTAATNIRAYYGETQVNYIPEFDPDILEYQFEVPVGTTEIGFNVTTSANTSNVSYPDGLTLVAGKNVKRIKITAESGDFRIYTFTITRPYNQSNKLRNITVQHDNDTLTYTPTFDPDTNDYYLTVPNEIRYVTITGELADDSATLKGSGYKYELAAGDNKITLTVISEAGDENLYSINIHRTPSDNALISSITIEESGQVLVCSDDVFEYTITVSNEYKTANMIPILQHDGATYEIIQTAIPLLTSQANVFKIKVTAEDGRTEKIYTINVIRDKSVNANLSFLAMEEGALSPQFDKNVIEYNLSIPNEFTSGIFHYETEDPNAQVVITGNTNFVVGNNDVTVKVVPEKGEEYAKTYTLHVTRQTYTPLIDTLDSLTVDEATYTPTFDPHHGYYTATVEHTTESVYVGGVATDASSMITGLGYYNLHVGKNVIVVRVYTSDKQHTRDYQVVITRKGSSEARLANLVLEDAILDPAFNPDTYTYRVNTSDTMLRFSKIETMDPNATYEVWYNVFTCAEQEHSVTIVVTAEDGVTQKTYEIIVWRTKSSNNYLRTLSVGDYTLNPLFKKTIYTYNISVASDIGSVVISAAPEHALATVYGTGLIQLDQARTLAEIVVEAEDGSLRTYTVIINRVAKDDATLRRLVVNNGTIDPIFDPDTFEYDVVVPSDEPIVDLSYNTNDPNATSYNTDVTMTGYDTKDVEIHVTAEDGITKNTYILHITKGNVVSSLLKELEIKDYLVHPDFDPNVTSYDIILNNETNSVTFDKLATLDSGATIEFTPSASIVNGKYVVSGFNEDNKYYEVKIKVTASDGLDVTTYNLRFYHQEYANNFLKYIAYQLPEQDDAIYFPQPSFDKYTLTYYVSVPHEITQIRLIADYNPDLLVTGAAKPNDDPVTGIGLYTHLDVGTNNLAIDVNKDGIIRTYIVKVVRAASDQNGLTNFKIKFEEKDFTSRLVPAFDTDQHEYSLTVDNGTPYVEFSGVVPDKATVRGFGKVETPVGITIHQVIVTSQSGIVNTYKFTITRNPSSDSELIDLVPSAGYLDPVFELDRYEFDVYLNSSENKLGFTCHTRDNLATIIGIDEEFVPDGESTRIITVRAEDNSSTQYTIHVHKSADNNAYLRSLTIEGATLDQEFSPTRQNYTVTVPNSVKTITPEMVIAIPQDGDASVLKSGALQISTKNYTTYTIVVTAADNITQVTYQVDVIRQVGSEHTLASLKPSAGYLQQTFKPNNTLYTYLIPPTKNTVSIDDFIYTLTDENSVVTYSDPVDLTDENHPTTFTIRVTAEDGSGYTDYILQLKYDYNSDNTLSSLKVENGYMAQVFKTGLYTYDVYEYEDAEYDIITATTNNATASIISGIGRFDFTDDLDEYYDYVVVKAQDGSLLTYTLHFIRTFKTDKTLAYLGVEGVVSEREHDGVFEPEFDPDVVEYDVDVPFTYTKLNMIYILKNNEQFVKYKINNTYIENNTYNLPKGKTVVEVEVYDGLHKLTTTYTVNVTRLESYDAYLTNLVITDPSTGKVYNLNPSFAANQFEYEIEVPSTAQEVKVKATTQYSGSIYCTDSSENNIIYRERSTTIVRFNGYNYLFEGDNLLRVNSTAPDGTVYQYLVHVIKQPIFNSWLKQITVSTGEFHELTPQFRKTNFSYTLHLPVEIDKVTVNAIPDDSTTVVRGTGEYDIVLGMNVVTLTSTAVDGSVSIYQVGIIQESERDVDLKQFEIDECQLVPDYDKTTIHYTCEVDPSVSNLHVTAIPEDPKAIVNITGDKNLITGKNMLEVQVVSPDRAVSKTYQVEVMRNINNNANLTSISVYNTDNLGVLTTYDLVPEFNTANTDYKVTVPNDIDNVIVAATKQVMTARVSGTGVHFLNYGNNYIDVTVTAEDNRTTKTYQINVYREYNLYLSELITNVGTLTPVFNKTTKEYNLSIPNKTTSVYVKGIPENSDVVVTGNDTYTVYKEQSTRIVLVLTDPDGNTDSYVINAIQEKNGNPYASSIIVEEGALSPQFDKMTAQYRTDIRPTMIGSSLNISVQPEENTTTYKINGNSELKMGDNVILIVMTAEDGTSTTYKITATVQGADFFNNVLSSLSITPVGVQDYTITMNPNFDPNTNTYLVTVPYSIDKAQIDATPQSNNATVEGTGQIDIPLGRSVHNVTVTSFDGEKNTYSLNIYRLEDDASLSQLIIKDHTYTPIFNRNTLEYTVEIETGEAFLDITATPVDPGATVTITGNGGFVEGENTINIHVETRTGKTKDYVIHVRAHADSNPYLDELSITNYTFQPTFEPTSSTTYLLTVTSDVNSIYINAVPHSVTTRVEGAGAKELRNGNNTFEINTTAEDGTPFKYTIVVTRPADGNSKLASLEVTPGELDPIFKPGVLDYEVVLPPKSQYIRVNATPDSEQATVDGNDTYILTSKETIIPITVTAADDSVTIYSVKVIVQDYSSSLLANLRVKEGELIPNFLSSAFEYSVIVPYEINKLNLIYATEDDNATVHISGNEAFEIGINTVEITVLASDGVTTSTYTLSVIRQPYANDYLSNIVVTNPEKTVTYPLTPEFDMNNLYYEVTVPNAVDRVRIRADRADPSNIVSANNTGVKVLAVGENIYPITVYSTSGYQRTYTVVVKRQTAEESAADNYLITLEEDVPTADLDPVFNPDVTNYSITVPSDTNSITFTGTSPVGTTVVGFGKSILKYGVSQRTITVTGTNGNTKNYYINITRPYTNKTRVTNIIPSVGTLNYVDSETEYDMEVPGDTDEISFQVITADPNATVTGNEPTRLQAGLNIITITVTGTDGEVKNIHIFVTKKSSVSAVILEKHKLILGVGEQLSVNYEFNPADTDYTDVTWSSEDSSIASVAANGLMTGVKPGVTNITITSDANSEATDTIEVEVINKKLINHTHTVVRKETDNTAPTDYVYTKVHGITVSEFIQTFDNKMELVHIYGADNVEIDKASNTYICSGMNVTLELDNNTIDRLLVIVKGDTSGDGFITAVDVSGLMIAIGGTDNLVYKLAGDLNLDGFNTAVDNSFEQILVGDNTKTLSMLLE